MAIKRKALSTEEINQRAAVLRRFRELLKAQRDRFRTYLEVLERQRESIENGTADDLVRHVELEERLVADIFSIQKVIDPMESLYRAVEGPAYKNESQESDDVGAIKNTLESLKKEVASQAKRNRGLLSKRMAEVRSEIKNLRSNPYNRKQTAYSGALVSSRIDIRG